MTEIDIMQLMLSIMTQERLNEPSTVADSPLVCGSAETRRWWQRCQQRSEKLALVEEKKEIPLTQLQYLHKNSWPKPRENGTADDYI